MKKYILIALALSCAIVALADEYVRWVDLTTTGTTTADAVHVAKAGRVTSVLAIYQSVDTQTNTCLAKVYLNGDTAAKAVLVKTLAAVTNATASVTVGEGDVSADIDNILLLGGDSLWLDATGAAATNVIYKILIKETNQ